MLLGAAHAVHGTSIFTPVKRSREWFPRNAKRVLWRGVAPWPRVFWSNLMMGMVIVTADWYSIPLGYIYTTGTIQWYSIPLGYDGTTTWHYKLIFFTTRLLTSDSDNNKLHLIWNSETGKLTLNWCTCSYLELGFLRIPYIGILTLHILCYHARPLLPWLPPGMIITTISYPDWENRYHGNPAWLRII